MSKRKEAQETGRLAEDYRQSRKAELWTSTSTKTRRKASYLCGQVVHLAKDCLTKPVGLPPFSMGENTEKGKKRTNLLCAITVIVEIICCNSVLVVLCFVE